MNNNEEKDNAIKALLELYSALRSVNGSAEFHEGIKSRVELIKHTLEQPNHPVKK